jgi:Polyketide cyclase / dehydrase and lipid transport
VPRIEATTIVDVPAEVAFALSQSQGEIRYAWDPFVREQHLLDGANRPARGVRTRTRSRHGLVMVSEYTAVNPPRQVGMRMVQGPWFFRTFSGGWSFAPLADGRTRATWRYQFTCRPRALAVVAEPVGRWLLGRDIRRRLDGFARGCGDPELLARLT